MYLTIKSTLHYSVRFVLQGCTCFSTTKGKQTLHESNQHMALKRTEQKT